MSNLATWYVCTGWNRKMKLKKQKKRVTACCIKQITESRSMQTLKVNADLLGEYSGGLKHEGTLNFEFLNFLNFQYLL